MRPLIVLLGTFLITFLVLFATDRCWNLLIAGNIAMSVMLLFMSLGHFILTENIALMLPPLIKFRDEVVIVSGVIEVVLAMGLVIAETRAVTSWIIIAFFILVFPANVYAMSKNVNHMKGTYDGPGYKFLWFRIPLQLFFIAWVVYFGIYLETQPV